MKTNNWSRFVFFALLVALVSMASVACGSSPTAPPKVELCEDPSAQNYNQPAPCVAPVPVAETTIEFMGTNPAPGTTLKATVCSDPDGDGVGDCVDGEKFTMKFRYTLSDEHLRIAKEKGYRITVAYEAKAQNGAKVSLAASGEKRKPSDPPVQSEILEPRLEFDRGRNPPGVTSTVEVTVILYFFQDIPGSPGQRTEIKRATDKTVKFTWS